MFCSKLLVAYDGSELAEKALGRAALIVKTNPLITVNVLVVSPGFNGGRVYASINESLYESEAKYWEEVVQKVKRSLSHLANPHSVTLAHGTPQTEIVKFAEEQDCDLIVMGSRGMSGMKELLLGSVSHYVVQHAHIPVLIEK
ncbi:universal stress protein [Paenibacillus sp. GCM10027628]|uniref:universal stress protein n=1 Tax=Paenibacillus sp. GCM10027628 TaxID=3273413 RepID=UPI00363EA07B